MITAKQVANIPNATDQHLYTLAYKELIPDGMKIVEEAAVGDYQGDYLYLAMDEESGKFHLFIFGYGSCSGCDAMMSLCSEEDVEKRTKSLQEWCDNAANSVVLKSKEEMLAYLDARDEGNSYWMSLEGAEEALELFRAAVNK